MLSPASIQLGKITPSLRKTPDYTLADGPQKASTPQDWLEVEVSFSTTPEEIDSLDFRYTVQINNTFMDGNVSHVTIPAGKEHYSVMYVPPRMLLRVTGRKPVTIDSIQNIYVSVDYKGLKLAEAVLKPTPPTPNLPFFPGMLTKPETPFALLDWDRYEAVETR